MSHDEIVSEVIPFCLINWVVALMVAMSAFFIYLTTNESFSGNSAFHGFYLIIGVFMAAVTTAVISFRRLAVSITLETLILSSRW